MLRARVGCSRHVAERCLEEARGAASCADDEEDVAADRQSEGRMKRFAHTLVVVELLQPRKSVLPKRTGSASERHRRQQRCSRLRRVVCGGAVVVKCVCGVDGDGDAGGEMRSVGVREEERCAVGVSSEAETISGGVGLRAPPGEANV